MAVQVAAVVFDPSSQVTCTHTKYSMCELSNVQHVTQSHWHPPERTRRNKYGVRCRFYQPVCLDMDQIVLRAIALDLAGGAEL